VFDTPVRDAVNGRNRVFVSSRLAGRQDKG